jgi:hypothetical protein
LGILVCGRPFLAIFSILLLPIYFPSALLALLIAANYYADRRSGRLEKVLGQQEKRAAQRENRERRAARAVEARKEELIRAFREPPKPAPVLTLAGPAQPPAPRKPPITLAEIREHAVATKDAAIRAYHNLPEWAQPISWGLAAGTPVSVAIVLFMLFRGR